VPLELRPGIEVPIPCRHCHKSMTRFTVTEGTHSILCSRCGASTEVQVFVESGTWRLKTGTGPGPVKPKPPR
jgi:hypothetical protein